jgi:ABC-type dipeptide/oligopeptide/nickel transport system ATPase component
VSEGGSEALLDVRDLEVSYNSRGQDPVRALRGVSVRIQAGESIAILGESGSGKSTLALSIPRLLPPASIVNGSIRFQGFEILQAPDRILQRVRGARVAVIFQQPGMALNPFMRAGRQVAEVIRAHSQWKLSRCMEEAKLALERVFGAECGRLCRAYPHQLSSGQRQRVAIAQALACRPELIIADEPTASLDAVARAGILELFRDLRRASPVSLMLVTHDPATLPGLTDRVVVLRRGEIVEEGHFEDICQRPRTSYTSDLLGSMPEPWPV